MTATGNPSDRAALADELDKALKCHRDPNNKNLGATHAALGKILFGQLENIIDLLRSLSPYSGAELPVAWPNGCDNSVPAALRFLADNDRPSGGQQRFNAEHLYQLADEIERMASNPLYAPTTLPRDADVTNEMIRAGRAAHHKHGCGAVREIFTAMLAVSPPRDAERETIERCAKEAEKVGKMFGDFSAQRAAINQAIAFIRALPSIPPEGEP